MTAKEAIEQLKQLDPDEHIILAYWTNDFFPEINEEKWAENTDYVEAKMDWSGINDDINNFMEEN